MTRKRAARSADKGSGGFRYQRHQPEQTLLYEIIEQHYPAFTAHLAARGTVLPEYVQREFDDYLKCGRLEHGFMWHIPCATPCRATFGRANRLSCRFVLRVRCDTCHAEHLVAFSCKHRGLLRASCPPPFGPAFGCSKSLPAILSAPVAARGAWRKAPHTWWMKFCLLNRCANGCSVCRSRSGFCLPVGRRSWARCWASSTASLPPI